MKIVIDESHIMNAMETGGDPVEGAIEEYFLNVHDIAVDCTNQLFRIVVRILTEKDVVEVILEPSYNLKVATTIWDIDRIPPIGEYNLDIDDLDRFDLILKHATPNF